jgi:hypothetical protein
MVNFWTVVMSERPPPKPQSPRARRAVHSAVEAPSSNPPLSDEVDAKRFDLNIPLDLAFTPPTNDLEVASDAGELGKKLAEYMEAPADHGSRKPAVKKRITYKYKFPSRAPLDKSITQLRDACARKRAILWGRAESRQRWQRVLHFTAGVITLVAGGSVTALLATVSGALTAKIAGSVIGILSGVLSLVVTIFYDVKETDNMFAGAAKYGSLRDQLTTLLDKTTEPSNKVVESLAKLRKDYGDLAQHYDRMVPRSQLSADPPPDEKWLTDYLLIGYEGEGGA